MRTAASRFIAWVTFSVVVPVACGGPPGGGLDQPRLVFLQPGIVIEGGPPTGWTHLVLESLPRLGSGDLASLPSSASRMATLFRTVIAVEVVPDPRAAGAFVLRRVGLGLCTPDRQGRDVVVTSDQIEHLDIGLGRLEKVVLGSAEAELAKGRLVGTTPTFALFRGPATLRVGDEHHAIELFYAFLVDRERGGVRALLWSHDTTQPPSVMPTRIVELAGGTIWNCPLDVKARRLLGTIPVGWSFAMQDLPPGRSLPVPADLAPLLVAAAEGKPDARALEERLSAYLRAAPDDAVRPAANCPAKAPAAVPGSGPVRSGRTSSGGSGPRGTSRPAR